MSDLHHGTSSKELYLRLLRYARPYLKIFAISLLGMIVAAATEPAFARLMKPLVDGNFNKTAGTDLMLEVGQKNVRDGYMTQAAFDATAPKIREAKGKYSVSDCQGSSGNKKSFYQCMSSSKNHVTGCDKQYKH